MKIIDDVFPEVIQDYIEELVLRDSTFSWNFLDDVTFTEKNNKERVQSIAGFVHMSVDDGKINPQSSVGVLMHVPMLMICDKFGLNISTLSRQRWGMYLPQPNPPLHHNPHIDDQTRHHVVVLYYVNDSDGDTFFFDKNKNVTDRVTPKKGRAILFDGKNYHASSSPTKNVRVTLNLNFHGKDRDIYTSGVPN